MGKNGENAKFRLIKSLYIGKIEDRHTVRLQWKIKSHTGL